MYKIRVGITEVQDKKFLKALSPIFIWALSGFILLILIGVAPYESIAFLATLMLMICLPLCIPIGIIVYKRTAPFRNQIYKRSTLTFDVLDGKVYMNGTEVGIMLNTEAQFIINISDFEGYAVKKSDTQEFF